MQFWEVLKSVSELETGHLELNRSRLSNHLWTRILGETTAASSRSDISPTGERKDRSRCPDERVGRRSRHSRVAFPRHLRGARLAPGRRPRRWLDLWSARATTAAALGKNRLFLPSDAGQADVAPSLFGWVGFLVKLPRSRSADVISWTSVTLWMYDTSRAFRLSHLTQGSSTDFNTSQNWIVRLSIQSRISPKYPASFIIRVYNHVVPVQSCPGSALRSLMVYNSRNVSATVKFDSTQGKVDIGFG